MVNAKKVLSTFAVALLAGGIGWVAIQASDHDDGETDRKARSLNLTDLYVFRENDQDNGAAAGNLVFVMNTNPRSVARQQYYFSNNARYELHFTRVADTNVAPTGLEGLVFAPRNAAAGERRE